MKPDPPLNVTVEAVEKSPQRLRVNWSYPSSWDPRFYWLHFQVRYRPEPAQTFTEVRPPLLRVSPSVGLSPRPGEAVPQPTLPVSPPGGPGGDDVAGHP